MKTVNVTLKIEPEQLINFENWLGNNLEVISFRILPDTAELYEKSTTFKKLVKAVKTAQDARDKYINQHNYE